MRIIITTAIIAAVFIGFTVWALSGITIFEGAAIVALSLLISLALGQLREKDVKLTRTILVSAIMADVVGVD
jgi:hypothetical protein